MRVYTSHEEEGVKAQRELRDWAASGRITESQRVLLDKESNPGLRRAPGILRGVLLLFTMGVVSALVWLINTLFEIRGRETSTVVYMTFALFCYGVAEYLARREKFYRYGVEEALTVQAVLLFFVAAQTWFHSGLGFNETSAWIFLACAVGAWWIYMRFGYAYAALGGLLFMTFVPICFTKSLLWERTLWVSMFLILAVLVRPVRERHRDDFLDESYGFLYATLVFAVYLALNLRLSEWNFRMGGAVPAVASLPEYPMAVYWFTYACTWILPAWTLRRAILDKDRALLNVGIVMTLLTLITNKPYLGWARHEWDPMILGVLLAGVALHVRRWLAEGPSGMRRGYTAERLSHYDKQLIAALGTLSAAWQPGLGPASPASAKPDFGGGRSGGGGATGSF